MEEATLTQSKQDPKSKKGGYSVLAIPLVFGLILLAVIFLTEHMIDRAKIVLSLIMLAVSALCFALFFKRHDLQQSLAQQELLADRARDDLLFEMTALRARLSTVGERMQRQPAPDPNKMNKLLVQYASAAVMMVLQKERRFLSWGLWAAKLGKAAFDHFKTKIDH